MNKKTKIKNLQIKNLYNIKIILELYKLLIKIYNSKKE